MDGGMTMVRVEDARDAQGRHGGKTQSDARALKNEAA
jgi:hypothetical protein